MNLHVKTRSVSYDTSEFLHIPTCERVNWGSTVLNNYQANASSDLTKKMKNNTNYLFGEIICAVFRRRDFFTSRPTRGLTEIPDPSMTIRPMLFLIE